MCLKVVKRNNRERTRVQAVNGEYKKLRNLLPVTNRGKRISKENILNYSILYIEELRQMISDHDSGKKPLKLDSKLNYRTRTVVKSEKLSYLNSRIGTVVKSKHFSDSNSGIKPIKTEIKQEVSDCSKTYPRISSIIKMHRVPTGDRAHKIR